MNALKHAREKFWEADYFCILVQSVCMNHQGLIPHIPFEVIDIGLDGKRFDTTPSVVQEVGYLFSAFLNSSYGLMEYLKRDRRFFDKVKEFQFTHSEFYGSGPMGGYRTRATHFTPVKPQHVGSLENPNDKYMDDFHEMMIEVFGPGREVTRETMDAEEREAEAMFTERPERPRQIFYYLEKHEPQVPIHMKCSGHMLALGKLIKECELIESVGDET